MFLNEMILQIQDIEKIELLKKVVDAEKLLICQNILQKS